MTNLAPALSINHKNLIFYERFYESLHKFLLRQNQIYSGEGNRKFAS